IARTIMHRYTPSFRGPAMDVPVTLARFRSMESTHREDLTIAVAYALPSPPEAKDEPPEHQFGAFFLDAQGNRMFELRDPYTRTTEAGAVMLHSGTQSALLRCVSLYTAPDSGFLSLEWIRSEDEAVCVKRQPYHAEPLLGSPAISDVMVAKDVQRGTSTYPLQRGEIDILPLPYTTLQRGSKPFIYFEVYDLAQREDGSTDFDLHITLSRVEERSGIADAFSTLLNAIGLSEDESMTTTTGYVTQGPHAQLFLQLDVEQWDPGEYEILVTIADHVRKEEAERRLRLQLVD
ncbi:MAG: hypothetical protein JXA28_05980, partial [Bacteroidetes bacterium]|nr:hypothetical protein [Bacteroidota bacterium]